jgi:hypothetical protein
VKTYYSATITIELPTSLQSYEEAHQLAVLCKEALDHAINGGGEFALSLGEITEHHDNSN